MLPLQLFSRALFEPERIYFGMHVSSCQAAALLVEPLPPFPCLPCMKLAPVTANALPPCQVSANINALQSWQSTVAATCRPVQLGGFNFKVCSYVGPFGLGDLYLGLAGAVLGTLPSSFLFFCVDEAMKRTLTKRLKKDRCGLLLDSNSGIFHF